LYRRLKIGPNQLFYIDLIPRLRVGTKSAYTVLPTRSLGETHFTCTSCPPGLFQIGWRRYPVFSLYRISGLKPVCQAALSPWSHSAW